MRCLKVGGVNGKMHCGTSFAKRFRNGAHAFPMLPLKSGASWRWLEICKGCETGRASTTCAFDVSITHPGYGILRCASLDNKAIRHHTAQRNLQLRQSPTCDFCTFPGFLSLKSFRNYNFGVLGGFIVKIVF